MHKGYSKYLRFILLFIDSVLLFLISFLDSEISYQHISFIVYIILFWVLSTLITGYYNIYRFTGKYHLFKLICTQLSLFVLGFFAYFGVFKEGIVVNNQFQFLLKSAFILSFLKFFSFSLLKVYRRFGRNFRNVVFYELDETSDKLIHEFSVNKDYGYKVKGSFSATPSVSLTHLGTIDVFERYIEHQQIDEVYVAISKITNEKLTQLIKLSNSYKFDVKLIPNAVEIYSKQHKEQFYNDTFKILRVLKLPFEYAGNRFIKRCFDIFFSLFVILFLMSWLTPLLWLLIKLESKGPLFFKQERDGLQGSKFVCYKFRSMRVNTQSDTLQASRNDSRITFIGKFIRKTSIDELPQFYNVFLGDMSVVGPRPHMNIHNEKFSKEIENYMDRNAVKPGITGLAQVSGYRGEIKQKSDIENRVRLDIFYIENWSFFLDIKIILKTIVNIFKGEENAY